MNLILNGRRKEVAGPVTLDKLIETFCTNKRHVIAEVNGTVIKDPRWPSVNIAEGDEIELVNFVGGG